MTLLLPPPALLSLFPLVPPMRHPAKSPLKSVNSRHTALSVSTAPRLGMKVDARSARPRFVNPKFTPTSSFVVFFTNYIHRVYRKTRKRLTRRSKCVIDILFVYHLPVHSLPPIHDVSPPYASVIPASYCVISCPLSFALYAFSTKYFPVSEIYACTRDHPLPLTCLASPYSISPHATKINLHMQWI